MKTLDKKFLKCENCGKYHILEQVIFSDNVIYHTCSTNKAFYQTMKDILDTQILKSRIKRVNYP